MLHSFEVSGYKEEEKDRTVTTEECEKHKYIYRLSGGTSKEGKFRKERKQLKVLK